MNLMAVMKPKQIREMSDVDLKKRLNELRLEIAKERGQVAIGGTPSNPGKIREVKRTIARMLTELNKRKK